MSDKFVYHKNKFSIPVTKAEPLEKIQFIVEDFKKKKLSFCIDGSGDSWELWRMAEEDDIDKIKKKKPPLNPRYLFIDGKEVENFEVLD